jgi:hypothetical protein
VSLSPFLNPTHTDKAYKQLYLTKSRSQKNTNYKNKTIFFMKNEKHIGKDAQGKKITQQ